MGLWIRKRTIPKIKIAVSISTRYFIEDDKLFSVIGKRYE